MRKAEEDVNGLREVAFHSLTQRRNCVTHSFPINGTFLFIYTLPWVNNFAESPNAAAANSI